MYCVRKFVIKDCEQGNKSEDWKQTILEYVCCCIFLNFLLLLFLAVFRHNTQNIYEKLNVYSNFAMKYLVLSVLAAVVVPFVERYIRKNVTVTVTYYRNFPEFFTSPVSKWIYQYGLYVLAFVAVSMHFVRIFDNAFWLDETTPLGTRTLGFGEMLYSVAIMGHTPLHYILIWVFYRLFGDSGSLYHFVSLIPYILIVLLSITLVRKWFGKRTAAILILLSAFLENAIQYNVEVRMYSWCQMFIFLAFLMMYQILQTKKTRYFVLMTMSSLGAVYSHSFALASIGILYLFLLVYVVIKDRKNTWKVFLSGGSVLLLFLLWMLYGKQVNGHLVSQYDTLGGTIWRVCFEYIFSSRYSMYILALFAVLFFYTFIRETGILKFQSDENGKTQLSISLNYREWTFSSELVWLLAGTFAAIGTIIAAEWFEYLFYPIIALRYLYPSFILVWFVLGICISKCKTKKLISTALTALILVSCVPRYLSTVIKERQIEKSLESTLAATAEILDGGGYILTDELGRYMIMERYYYPNASHIYFEGDSLPEFKTDKTNWLFLTEAISEEILECVKDRGYLAEEIVSNGIVGNDPVWVYKITR